MRRAWVSRLLPILLCLPVAAFCQSGSTDVLGAPTDATEYPIAGVGFINMNNGNLHLDIPLWTMKGPNGTSSMTSLMYDSSTYTVVQVPVQGGTGT